MQELLLAVARGLVEDKEAVQVTVDPMREDGTVVYHLKVAEGYGPRHRQAGPYRQGDPRCRACRCRPSGRESHR